MYSSELDEAGEVEGKAMVSKVESGISIAESFDMVLGKGYDQNSRMCRAIGSSGEMTNEKGVGWGWGHISENKPIYITNIESASSDLAVKGVVL